MKSAFGTFDGPPFRIHHKSVVAPYAAHLTIAVPMVYYFVAFTRP